MNVIIGKRIYQMGQRSYQKFLDEVAKEQVPFGIYAVEKNGKSHMLLEYCDSITQLKVKTQEYRRQGYKVYANGR